MRRNCKCVGSAQCTVPLGMESGEIPDSDITASSTFENGNVGPHIGRLEFLVVFDTVGLLCVLVSYELLMTN